MPFFSDTRDDEKVGSTPETEAETHPLPVHGLDPSSALRYRPSEESIRTELCEGPLLAEEFESENQVPESEERCTSVASTSDRTELIERLKRGESPTWVPHRRVGFELSTFSVPAAQSLFVFRTLLTDLQHDSFFSRHGPRDHSPTPRPKSRDSTGLLTASLAKAGKETDRQQNQTTDIAERMGQGLSIERPRSALHSGDFTQDAASSTRYSGLAQQQKTIPEGPVFSNPNNHQSSWIATSPPRGFTLFRAERGTPFPELSDAYKSSPPSLSSSLSSSFVYKHPTSPLVQSESNEDLSVDSMRLDFGTPSRSSRRQTLHTLSHHLPATAQRIPSMRRQTTFPYQAHQPRKSLTSAPAFPLAAGSSPSIPFVGARRPSVAALDSSPLQRTSMVGSYEESILRGRMSTTPSKPLDFMAQIGVLGLGNCKPSLKCPAHVTLPFPAVFYSYGSTSHGRSTSDDGPSPYVGQVDLENGLPNAEESTARRRRSRQRSGSLARPTPQGSVGLDAEMTGVDTPPPPPPPPPHSDVRGIAKHRRRGAGGAGGGSLKAPPGGSYRIPEKGQIQIIIKNQNKTAVKLFLVPYDLTGMEPGTKTFIRQRAYSSSNPATSADSTTDATATTTADSGETNSKQVLRYLVHLHICSPARGRHYLYKSIRVVFANRVPDGTERLRNEITLPEPRFTPYKPVRQMLLQHHHHHHHHHHTPSHSGSGSGSLGFSFGDGGGGVNMFGEPSESVPVPLPPALPSWEVHRRAASVQDGQRKNIGRMVVPVSSAAAGFAPLNFAKGEIVAAAAGGGGGGGGGVAGGLLAAGAGYAVTAEGLLSQRLRSLGMQGVCRGEVGDDEVGGT
ncbi:unnamed protein product [Discula destructiva]